MCCGKGISYFSCVALVRISSPNHFGIIEMCSIRAFVWNGWICRIQWFFVGVHCESGKVDNVVILSPAYAKNNINNCSRRVSELYIFSRVPSVILCVLCVK